MGKESKMDEGLTKELYEGVRKAYSAASKRPTDRHPFPVGRDFAESIGYPKVLLDSLPDKCVEAFTGVSNVSVFAEIPEGSTVLDLGCGAGLDALIAAGKTGPSGCVIGADFSRSMLERARQSAREAGITWLEFQENPAESLSLKDNGIDVALVNGIFNLNPKREAIFKELSRVVRPGGSVFAAELILTKPVISTAPPTKAGWFS
jgi:SAM-dependent methyltransferase